VNRRVVGALVGAIGALVVAGSTFMTWFGGRQPDEIPLAQLIQGSNAGSTSDFWGSIAAALGIVGAVGLLGTLLRSRFLLALGWLVGAATVGLLWVMLTIGDHMTDDDPGGGVWLSIAGLAVLLIGLVVMGPRRDAVEAPLSVFDGDPPQ